MTTQPHPLLDTLLAVAAGRHPPVDGAVTVLPPLAGGLEAVVAFTGHAVVATALDPTAVLATGADGYGGAVHPRVMTTLAGAGGWVGVHDVTLVGRGLGGGGLPVRGDLEHHPRVQLARALREAVRVHGDDRGLVTVGLGLAGRPELSIELQPALQGSGAGAGMLHDGLRLFEQGSPVFAAVAPGNARSLRMFLRAGFVPVASEVVIRPSR